MRKLLPVLAFVSTAVLANATTILSVTGTVSNSTSSAHADGSTVTFTFTLADYTATGDPFNSMDEPDEYDWHQLYSPYNPVYSDVDFTGTTGDFVNPSGVDSLSYLYLNDHILPGGTYVFLMAGVPSGSVLSHVASEIGLSVGSDYVKEINLNFTLTGVHLSGLGAANTNPEQYLSTVYGTYATTNDASSVLFDSGNRFDFSPTSLTIGVVPEPSVCGMLGAATVVLGLRRRRK